MIMSMFKITLVTNRKLCERALPDQIDRISKIYKPHRLILREKDLSEDEYYILAKKIIKKCNEYNIECILHKYINVACKLNHKSIHLSVEDGKNNKHLLKYFNCLGMSIHSLQQLKDAENLGATYVNAGHIFETNCKKGLPGRGINFLNDMCENSNVPVYAIGGINKDNLDLIKSTNAVGACIMSKFMKM